MLFCYLEKYIIHYTRDVTYEMFEYDQVFHFIQTWFILYRRNTRLLHSNTDILRYNQDIYSHFLGGIA
jgi:hypothetical protein